VITPRELVDVSSAVPGVLEAVEVDRSDVVEQGQVLARLDSVVERASVALAKTRATMETDIHLEEVRLGFEKRNRDRVNTLHQRKALSSHDKDRADRDADLSSWKLRQARDQFKVRQLELSRAEAVLSQKTIRSPINGVVVQRFKSPGEYVEDQPILRVARLDPLFVEAIVPMELFGQIYVGMEADVVAETISREHHRATVEVVDPMGDAASGTFGVRLELPNPGHRLPAGLKCALRFLPEPRLSGLTVEQPATEPLDTEPLSPTPGSADPPAR
jgi:RND family efflux transporter MFP subunit